MFGIQRAAFSALLNECCVRSTPSSCDFVVVFVVVVVAAVVVVVVVVCEFEFEEKQ